MIQQKSSALNTEQLYQAIQTLSASDRVDLISKMLQGSGLSVTFENLNSQVHKMNSTELSDLIRAIAKRVENE